MKYVKAWNNLEIRVVFFLVLVLFLVHPGIIYHQGLCLEPYQLYLFQPTKKRKETEQNKKNRLDKIRQVDHGLVLGFSANSSSR